MNRKRVKQLDSIYQKYCLSISTFYAVAYPIWNVICKAYLADNTLCTCTCTCRGYMCTPYWKVMHSEI